MPQALVCNHCTEPFIVTGADIELVGESTIGCRHRCGAMNELEFVRTDEAGEAVYRIVGVKQAPRGYSSESSTGLAGRDMLG